MEPASVLPEERERGKGERTLGGRRSRGRARAASRRRAFGEIWGVCADGVKSPLCRVPPIWHSAKFFFNFFKIFAECHVAWHSAKRYFLKKICLPSAPYLALDKVFFKFF